MKTLVTILAIAIATPAMAAAPLHLNCSAENGNRLEFIQKYGELYVEDKAGNEIASLDALGLGRTQFLDSMPPQKITPIVTKDEVEQVIVARIIDINGRVKVSFEKTDYRCR